MRGVGRWCRGLVAAMVPLGLSIALGHPAGAAGTGGAAHAAASRSALRHDLLTLADLAPGWTRQPLAKPATSGIKGEGCIAPLFAKHPSGLSNDAVSAQFSAGHDRSPEMVEGLADGKRGRLGLAREQHLFTHCTSFTMVVGGIHLQGTIEPLVLSSPIPTSQAFAFRLSDGAISISNDVVLFHTAHLVGLFEFESSGTPDPTEVATYAAEAVAKAQGEPVSPPTTPADSPPRGTAV